MPRPGMRCCDACHGLFTYDQLTPTALVAFKRPRQLCKPCIDEKSRLGLVKR